MHAIEYLRKISQQSNKFSPWSMISSKMSVLRLDTGERYSPP